MHAPARGRRKEEGAKEKRREKRRERRSDVQRDITCQYRDTRSDMYSMRGKGEKVQQRCYHTDKADGMD